MSFYASHETYIAINVFSFFHNHLLSVLSVWNEISFHYFSVDLYKTVMLWTDQQK